LNAKGIDISRYNGKGDWQKVKDSGVSFVIIKAGGIYSATGVCYQDSLLEDHVVGAKSVGIPYGLYFYFLPFAPVKNQIDFYQKLIDRYSPTIPQAFIDVESNNGQNSTLITSCLKEFMPAFSDMLHPAVIYTRASWWNPNVKPDYSWAGYDLWAARYASGLTSPWSDGNYIFRDWRDWTIWQMTGENNNLAKNYGFYDGDPDMDTNQINGDEQQFRAWAGLEPPRPTVEERVTALELAVFGKGG
jgi:lysozyme